MADRDGILRKIRACFARGDKSRGASEAEAATALEMAAKLMAAHDVQMAEVEASEQTADLGELMESDDLDVYKNLTRFERTLSHIGAYLFGVRPFINYSKKHPGKMTVVYIGYQRDVAIASEVYRILRQEILDLGTEYVRTHPDASKAERYNFADGVAARLIERARQLKKSQVVTDRSLVVVDQKKARVDGFFKQMHPNTRLVKRDQSWSKGALAGFEKGNDINLNFGSSVKGGGRGSLKLGYDK